MRHVGQALVVGVGVDGRDEPFLDAEGVVEHLGDRRQAVGRARGVGDDPVLRLQLVVVDADHDRGVDLVLGRHGQHDLVRSGLEVFFQRRPVAKHAGRLDHDPHLQVFPRDLGRVTMLGHRDLEVVDEHRVARYPDGLVEPTHHRVVLEQVGQLIVIEQVVDCHDPDVLPGAEDAKHSAADAAKAIDSNSHRHHATSLFNSLNLWIRSTARWA